MVTGHARKVPPAATEHASGPRAAPEGPSGGAPGKSEKDDPRGSSLGPRAGVFGSRGQAEKTLDGKGKDGGSQGGGVRGGNGRSASEGVGAQGGGSHGGKGEPTGGNWAVDIEHRGPSVVLWLWEAVAGGGEVVLRPQPIRFTAGPQGAPLCRDRRVCETCCNFLWGLH